MQGPRTRPRKPIRKGEVLFAVGGWCSGDAIASVERWGHLVTWSPGHSFTWSLLHLVTWSPGHLVTWSPVPRYDPQTGEWKMVSPMSKRRSACHTLLSKPPSNQPTNHPTNYPIPSQVRGGCGRAERPAVRRGRPRRPVLPQQYREVGAPVAVPL